MADAKTQPQRPSLRVDPEMLEGIRLLSNRTKARTGHQMPHPLILRMMVNHDLPPMDPYADGYTHEDWADKSLKALSDDPGLVTRYMFSIST